MAASRAPEAASAGGVIEALIHRSKMPWFFADEVFADEATPITEVLLDRLAATQGLSAHDAACREQALRRSLVLVSFDARLLAAAQAPGHPVSSAPQDIGN